MTDSKRIFLSPPHMSGHELELVAEAFASNYVAPAGPQLAAFEREFSEYTGIPHCVALVNGTAAIHLALRGLGVGPGDRVIASTLTFVASVSPIVYLGAEPVFVDSDEATWNLSPELLAEELERCAEAGRLPKAILPTDLYGQCADLERIQAVAARYEVPVVVDSAEAMGATYRGRHAGYGARAAVYSFNGNKIITSSGGGMLASHDPELIAHARFLSTQAREPVAHYEHKELGYNYRMSNIVAAIGLAQLRVLDERVQRRREIFDLYREELSSAPGVRFMPEATYGRANRWLTVLTVEPEEFGATTAEIQGALEAQNIESRPVWKPMHLQPVFREAQICGGQVSERLFRTGLCLPSGTAMRDDDVRRVAALVRASGKKSAKPD